MKKLVFGVLRPADRTGVPREEYEQTEKRERKEEEDVVEEDDDNEIR